MHELTQLPPLVWKSSVLYRQGDTSLHVNFILSCDQIPAGSYVALSCDKEGPQPPIEIAPTRVQNSGSFKTGIISRVPVGFSGTLTYSLYGMKKMPKDSSVTLDISYATGQIHQHIEHAAEMLKTVCTTNF